MRLCVALGADHGGYLLKTELLPWLQYQGYEVLDLGAYTLDSDDDYPDFAVSVPDIRDSCTGGRNGREEYSRPGGTPAA